MAILFTALEESRYTLKNKRVITKWIKECVAEEQGGVVGDISVVFCTDEELLKVNIEYLQHNYYTDIITFDYCEDGVVSGDLMISVDTVNKNSKLFGSAPVEEMHRIIIHGVLHLLGYKDKNEKDKATMSSKEDYYLAKLGGEAKK